MPDVQDTLNDLIELAEEIAATSDEIDLVISNGLWKEEVEESGAVEQVISYIREMQRERNGLEKKAIALIKSLA